MVQIYQIYGSISSAAPAISIARNHAIQDKAVLAKLFTDIAPRFSERPGGCTRILKLGQRYGDASEMVFLELVERKETVKKKKKKPAEKQEASES